MGLLTPDERRKLIALLLSLPNMDDPAARRLLLASLPQRLQDNVPFSNTPSIHIAGIVDTVNNDAWTYLRDGSPAVAIVIANAIGAVEGSSLAKPLENLQYELNVRAALSTLENLSNRSRSTANPPIMGQNESTTAPPKTLFAGIPNAREQANYRPNANDAQKLPHRVPASRGTTPNSYSRRIKDGRSNSKPDNIIIEYGSIVLGVLGSYMTLSIMVLFLGRFDYRDILAELITLIAPSLFFWSIYIFKDITSAYIVKIMVFISLIVDIITFLFVFSHDYPDRSYNLMIDFLAIDFLIATILLFIKYLYSGRSQ
jgi:hypothetical protein